MSNLYIGLMSGTSRDSLDGCLVSFENGLKIEDVQTVNFSENYQSSMDEDFISKEITNKSIVLVDKLVSGRSKEDIVAIAFPGQTISHTDEFSLQAGSPEALTKELGIPVYGDFRNFDISKGGKGAPLIPAFHKFLLSEESKNKIIFNIGGIANGTYLCGSEIKLASDVGPGNCLMDAAMRTLNLGNYDKNGDIANKGNLNTDIFQLFLQDMNGLSYPRADDISVYTRIFEKHKTKLHEFAAEDMLCTLTELTAKKINDFIEACGEVDELVFHGGGTENRYLMERISSMASPVEVKTIDHIAPSKYIEAIAFAYLAYEKRAVLFK